MKMLIEGKCRSWHTCASSGTPVPASAYTLLCTLWRYTVRSQLFKVGCRDRHRRYFCRYNSTHTYGDTSKFPWNLAMTIRVSKMHARMADIDVFTYKPVSDAIIENLKPFYRLGRDCHEGTGAWFGCVQDLFGISEFSTYLEYVLISDDSIILLGCCFFFYHCFLAHFQEYYKFAATDQVGRIEDNKPGSWSEPQVGSRARTWPKNTHRSIPLCSMWKIAWAADCFKLCLRSHTGKKPFACDVCKKIVCSALQFETASEHWAVYPSFLFCECVKWI